MKFWAWSSQHCLFEWWWRFMKWTCKNDHQFIKKDNYLILYWLISKINNAVMYWLSPENVSFRLLGPADVSLAQLFSGFGQVHVGLCYVVCDIWDSTKRPISSNIFARFFIIITHYWEVMYMVSFLSSFHNPLSTLETKVPNFWNYRVFTVSWNLGFNSKWLGQAVHL